MTSGTNRLKGRDLKKKVMELLKEKDFSSSLDQLASFPGKQVVNPLLSFLLDHDELVRWRAITAIGVVVSELAKHDIEAARVVMRRLMWSLNDESGGIGWGAPEAMAEIMAQCPSLAVEYNSILISYLDEEGNFLEYEPLQKGLIWGIARVSAIYPELFQLASRYLPKYLTSGDPSIRGLSAFALGALGASEEKCLLQKPATDETEFQTFLNGELRKIKVSDLANQGVLMMG
jgi:hypothetical protein